MVWWRFLCDCSKFKFILWIPNRRCNEISGHLLQGNSTMTRKNWRQHVDFFTFEGLFWIATLKWSTTEHAVKSNSITMSVSVLASNALSVSSNPTLRRENTAYFLWQCLNIALKVVAERLFGSCCLTSLSISVSHSLSGLYTEEYQSTASDIPSITVIPRERSNSYILRQTLLDTVTNTPGHTLSYWVYLRWKTTCLIKGILCSNCRYTVGKHNIESWPFLPPATVARTQPSVPPAASHR